MKFTRSLPAKASASENVPASTVILRIFTFTILISDIIKLQPTSSPPSIIGICPSIQLIQSAGMTCVPFNPLKTAKYEIAVRAIPHQTAPYDFSFDW